MARRLVICLEYESDEPGVLPSDLATEIECHRTSDNRYPFSNACVWDEDDFYADVDDRGGDYRGAIRGAFLA